MSLLSKILLIHRSPVLVTNNLYYCKLNELIMITKYACGESLLVATNPCVDDYRCATYVLCSVY